MNIKDKSLQPHKEIIGLGKMISGIYCVRKEEIKNIHKVFFKFYNTRKSAFASNSPTGRNILRKNLSFEERPSLSPLIKEVENRKIIPSLSSENLPKRGNQEKIKMKTHLHESIVEEEPETPLFESKSTRNTIKRIEMQVVDHEPSSSSNDTNSLSSSNTQRLSLRLSQVFPQCAKEIQHHHRRSSKSNRSMTVINKNSSFVASEISRNTNEELEQSMFVEQIKRKTRINDFNVCLSETENDKIVITLKLPSGLQEILFINKKEFNKSHIEDLIMKHQLIEPIAADIRRQAGFYFNDSNF